MNAGREWQPLLDGSLRSQALETIGDIAEALRHPPEPTPVEGQTIESTQAIKFGLMTGRAGLAVFFAYLAEAGLHNDAEELAWDFLDESEAGLAEHWMGASLCEGFTGIAWAHAHLHQALSHAKDRGELKDLDEALIGLLLDWPSPDQYELLYGMVGIGVYALERLPRPRARRMLRLIVDRLEESAQRMTDGIAWLTPQTPGSPTREYNLGMAHGVPGVVALLARAVTARIERKRAFALLRESVRWLRAQRLPPEFGGGFPATISPGESPLATRVAWCYGDPGVAAALLAAARVLEQPDLEQEAIDLAVSAAARPPSESLIADAGICHGAAGLGQLYNRFFQMTGHPALGAAARDFFAQAIEFRRPGTGIAGYAPAPAPGSEDASAIDQNDAGLLSGAAGIGLALLAATTPVPPAWDRLLLADLPAIARC
ncbi:MAG TPA: lanthionine synthetase C family protein [Gemmatimonadales bacterium]|nr:lanthionine synthetase C family protein [Gemmatimonadales bacterium]